MENDFFTGIFVLMSGCENKEMLADSSDDVVKEVVKATEVADSEVTAAVEDNSGEDVNDAENKFKNDAVDDSGENETQENLVHENNAHEESIHNESTTEDSIDGDEASNGLTVKGVYRLGEPEFIDVSDTDIKFCKVAKDYIELSDSEFDTKYSYEKLWENGAFSRLLFTMNAKGKIIADIGIGSPMKKVLDSHEVLAVLYDL